MPPTFSGIDTMQAHKAHYLQLRPHDALPDLKMVAVAATGTNIVDLEACRRRGIVVVKWTVIAALGFFAVLILERLALML